jgi:hypothetical protein
MNRIWNRQRTRISKNSGSLLETDDMFDQIRSRFGRVPFKCKSHDRILAISKTWLCKLLAAKSICFCAVPFIYHKQLMIHEISPDDWRPKLARRGERLANAFGVPAAL